MPRHQRVLPEGVPVHHVQRGNNRGNVFVDDHDRRLYHALLVEGCRRLECSVHAYVLMSNHVHLLLTATRANAIAQLTQWMGRKYVRAFNTRHQRTGTLWEGRFRSSVVDSARYFLTCSRYIDQNPVRAGIVGAPQAYPWSSYARLGFGAQDDLITEHPEYRVLGDTSLSRQVAYRELCTASVTDEDVATIREASRKDDVLGTDDFVDQMRSWPGCRLTRVKHGGDRRSELTKGFTAHGYSRTLTP